MGRNDWKVDEQYNQFQQRWRHVYHPPDFSMKPDDPYVSGLKQNGSQTIYMEAAGRLWAAFSPLESGMWAVTYFYFDQEQFYIDLNAAWRDALDLLKAYPHTRGWYNE